ncbi:MAG: hypothetical protein QNI84_04800 [Henriciella sp.]|nr:hypothetical protein [Henriciella sp.]
MNALDAENDVLFDAMQAAGLEEKFRSDSVAYDDCPACRQKRTLRLSLRTERVQCSFCGMEGPLLTYLRERAEGIELEPEPEPCVEAEIIPILTPVVARSHDLEEPIEPVLEPIVPEVKPTKPPRPKDPEAAARLGERVIMTLLASVFLLAGLAAAGLSGFANYQAFSESVGDPVQARIWGWSGVIASICSFGGFTFFWWHASAKRWKESARSLIFALAGAATSLAGTAMFMSNNQTEQEVQAQRLVADRTLTQAQIDDWTYQLRGIPPQTRSVEGLEAYLAGVEKVGLTHQKPYRDAQNELGLAKRRAHLEAQIAQGRDMLRQDSAAGVSDSGIVKQTLPAWFFALMLEVFSSQGTSIAMVCLLLLYGVRGRVSPSTQPDLDSSDLADPEPA